MIPNPIIKVNGTTIHDSKANMFSVVDYEISSTFMQSAGSFSITFTDLDRDNVFPNDRIQIILDDTSIMRGLVDKTEEIISNDSVDLVVSGRDYAGWWLSSDAEPKVYNNVTDNAIIQDVLAQGVEQLGYGINLEYDLGNPFVIAKYEVGAGRSFYDVMADVANINNYYMHFDGDGKLHKMRLADSGPEVAFFDLDNKFEGTAKISRDISDAKSDIWIQGRIANVSGTSASPAKGSLASLLDSGPVGNLSSLLSAQKKGRKAAAKFLQKKTRPDKLFEDNRFRVEGRSLKLDPARDGSTFRRRIVKTEEKRLKTEMDKQFDLDFAKTAPVFDIELTFNKLVNIVVNQIVRVRYRDTDTQMVVHSVNYSDSADRQQTKLDLKLPGRIR